MNRQFKGTSAVFRRMIGIGAFCCIAAVAQVQAESIEILSALPQEAGSVVSDVRTATGDGTSAAQAGMITPNDWTYTALQRLVEHGAVTDTRGIILDGRPYSKDELMPLISDVVDKREQMNDNDREFAVRLYTENTRDIMEYRIARDKREKMEKQRRADEKRAAKAKQSGKRDVKLSESQEEALDRANEEVAKPEERALTDEQIQEKMKKFKIDDSRVKVGGDVRIRYNGTKDGKSKSDARARTELTFTL